MKTVEAPDDLNRAIVGERPAVVFFTAQWCGDCHYLKPALPELEALFCSHGDFFSVDIDAHPSLSQEHDVTGIPSMILFHRGREVYRLVNERRKTKDEVRRFLEHGFSLIH